MAFSPDEAPTAPQIVPVRTDDGARFELIVTRRSQPTARRALLWLPALYRERRDARRAHALAGRSAG